MEQQIATAEIPATIPIESAELSFAEQRALTREGKADAPNPAAPKVVPVVEAKPEATAEAEAASTKPDAELSDAGKKLRANRADERKAKIQREIDELTAQKHRLREELDRERATPTPRTAAPASTPQPAAEPTDPEPTLEAFIAANPQHADPYAGWQRDLARWDRRQEQKAFAAQRQRETAEQSARQAVSTFHETAATARTQYADYDVTFDALVAAVQGNPRETALTQAIAEAGAPLAYHLGKHPEDLNALLTAPHPRAFSETLGAIKHQLTAKPQKAAPKPSDAPAPHTPVAGGSTVPADDENTMDFGAFRRKKVAERRAATR